MNNADSQPSLFGDGPDFSIEDQFRAKGLVVCGVDEAGRGPLAGPVVTAAVILHPDHIPDGLNDSKKLSAKKRDELYDLIMANAHVGIASAPPSTIFERNIRGATLHAMAQAVKSLSITPDIALIDGRDIPPKLPCRGQALIKGDSRSLSIAAASIIAKVTRDRMCVLLDQSLPAYGFGKHKGYGTALHMQALQNHGATPHHRADFKPIAEIIANKS
ncbi:ribonuclease HII [Maritalea porphyrae]|jgi:ribonuclease HII|uniref:ribonuclease HII n=1 Tax=Maritalea porphyrae TaxID=880732 RepID=UPI0022AFE12A|nr:ribonuclease HII [Maritalea porphyrae]MCZ4271364.1 ribonuclease HII [Maritalea porphyrae]